MPRSSRSRAAKAAADSNINNNNNNNDNDMEEEQEEQPLQQPAGGRQLPAHVRQRQRAVAEREAARLARPERRAASTLGHADRKKSAVTSTPFGILASSSSSSSSTARKHVGNEDDNETTWCGPFTIARQMIAQREEAKRKREAELELDNNNNNSSEMNHPLDALMEQVEQEKQQKAHPSLLWKSQCVVPELTNDNDTGGNSHNKKPRLPTNNMEQTTTQKVPSLYQLCIDFVVRNFDHVESLGQVDHSIRTTMAHQLAGGNQLDPAALRALVEPGMEALELIDCANIPQEALVEALWQTPTLRYLILDQAGRCFGKATVETVLNPYQKKHAITTTTTTTTSTSTTRNPMPLFALNVGGAYLLTDSDAAKLIAALAPTLQSLAWKACPLLKMEMCQAVAQTFGDPSHTLLEFSLEDMTLERSQWEALIGIMDGDKDATAHKKKHQHQQQQHCWQRHLKSLTLKRVTGLQDDIVIPLLEGAPHLEHLDLSDNFDLTDACLGPLRATHTTTTTSSLRSLHLYQLRRLTRFGLEALFTPGLDDMAPPPQLKLVNLSHLDEDVVTDHVMELILQAASRKPTGMDGTMMMTSSSSTTRTDASSSSAELSLLGGMKRIEVQGSAITDHTLENIAATCAKTLEHLNVSFCSQISDKGLGYLVDQVGSQLEQVQIWGNAQITQEFWNGHSRVVVEGGGSKNIKGNSDHPVVVPLQITGAWMKKSGISSIRT